ncbi:hypothetical protein ACFPES_03090 [Paenibacillus sp. GCM10023248]|uniref:hypothetical protein n=1 Tax=unclassified Paenibacillus TaxID=185978 RepID=UPI002378330C|nr:hypothetical protein [Paenibacillus sp. MAHUQ-63]MDD9266010.1 hypothetical protein [Paenibacillus sp. MAHUQ-63]
MKDIDYRLHLISLLRHSVQNDPTPKPVTMLQMFSDIVNKSADIGDERTLEFIHCMMLLLKSFMEDGDQHADKN